MKLDKLGMILSIGCMIHCLLLPIILPLLPLLGFMVKHDGRFHLCLASAITVVALLALIPGVKQHKNYRPISFAALGISMITFAGLMEYIGVGVFSAIAITVCGSCYLTLGHYLNHKYSCACRHHEHSKTDWARENRVHAK